jgi:hypothetical protein
MSEETSDDKINPEDLDALFKAMAEAQEQSEYELPITVTEIQKKGQFVADHPMCACGTLVRIRPVTDKGDKAQTYLGIFIGAIATDLFTLFVDDKSSLITPKRGALKLLVGGNNPAIFVPALRRLVFGYESWWAPIENPEDAERMITDEDIKNVPYVKAIKAMLEREDADTGDVQPGG